MDARRALEVAAGLFVWGVYPFAMSPNATAHVIDRAFGLGFLALLAWHGVAAGLLLGLRRDVGWRKAILWLALAGALFLAAFIASWPIAYARGFSDV